MSTTNARPGPPAPSTQPIEGSDTRLVIERVTTRSGSVYEFAWDEQDLSVRGRGGFVRMPGQPWVRITMITGDPAVNTRMFWVEDDGSTVHTTRIATIEQVPA